MAKPTDVPEWATDDDFATGPAPVIGTPTKVAPTALKNQGFVPGTAAAAQIMNWLLNRNGRWAKWLDGLFEDDGSAAQVKRGLLQLVHAVQADIVAGDVSGAYARLRGEPGIAHTVASAVEDAVYASLTSWASDERARLTLRGAIREIRGRDVAGANAPIIIPHGLNVGASFTPPAGYLPMGIQVFSTAGSHVWTRPSGCRAIKVTCIGGGGGGGGGSGGGGTQETGGGGGGGGTCVLWLPDPGIDYPIVVGAGGGSRTDGGDSSFGSDLAIARGGSAGASAVSSFVAGGTGGHYEFGTYGFRGGDGGDASVWEGVARSGFGGSSSLGGGPRGVGSTTPEPMAGISARTGAWGAGGSGALLSVGGGMGHRGIVIVEAYA